MSDDSYAAWKIPKRNEWVVDNFDAVIAVWNGAPGGTANTVDYARKLGRSVLVIDPVKQTENWIMD